MSALQAAEQQLEPVEVYRDLEDPQAIKLSYNYASRLQAERPLVSHLWL
jgi:hypothetical protein